MTSLYGLIFFGSRRYLWKGCVRLEIMSGAIPSFYIQPCADRKLKEGADGKGRIGSIFKCYLFRLYGCWAAFLPGLSKRLLQAGTRNKQRRWLRACGASVCAYFRTSRLYGRVRYLFLYLSHIRELDHKYGQGSCVFICRSFCCTG